MLILFIYFKCTLTISQDSGCEQNEEGNVMHSVKQIDKEAELFTLDVIFLGRSRS